MDDSVNTDYKRRFKRFMRGAKTERLACAMAHELLGKCGFNEDIGAPLSIGSRTMVCWRDRMLVASLVGRHKISDGFRMVVAHLDSPHLDLKPHPFLEHDGYCYVDTHTYGAIKKHQWVGIPLAFQGVIVRRDGSSIQLQYDDTSDCPLLMISDVSLHFGSVHGSSYANDVVSYEGLDPIIMRGSKKDLLAFLVKRYGVSEDDFLSADVEIVPAQIPVEIGFDRRLIAAYGHDDRACAFATISALCDICRSNKIPEYTTIVVLSDKEEVGSIGATGIDGRIVENIIEDFICRRGEKGTAAQALRYSEVLCVDACPGYDPHFPSSSSDGNMASIGGGPCLLRYTGGATKGGVSEADIRYLAKVRRDLDSSKVHWQYAEVGSADSGSCGSEANCIAKYGGNVVDVGLPVLNLHAPLEIAAYSDIADMEDFVRVFLLSEKDA